MSCSILAGDANSQSMSPTSTPVLPPETLEAAGDEPTMIDPVHMSPVENINFGTLGEGADER